MSRSQQLTLQLNWVLAKYLQRRRLWIPCGKDIHDIGVVGGLEGNAESVGSRWGVKFRISIFFDFRIDIVVSDRVVKSLTVGGDREGTW